MLCNISMTIVSQGFHFLDNVIVIEGQTNLKILNLRPGFYYSWILVAYFSTYVKMTDKIYKVQNFSILA